MKLHLISSCFYTEIKTENIPSMISLYTCEYSRFCYTFVVPIEHKNVFTWSRFDRYILKTSLDILHDFRLLYRLKKWSLLCPI